MTHPHLITRPDPTSACAVWTLWDAGYLVSVHPTQTEALDAREAHLARLAVSPEDEEDCRQAVDAVPMRLEPQ